MPDFEVRELTGNKPVVDFISLDEDQNFWRVDFDKSAMPFFYEVWPYLTMGDLMRMSKTRQQQVLWSAKGYGYIVKINNDPRW